MVEAEDSIEGDRRTNELASQLLSNVSASTRAINNNGATQTRPTQEHVEEEVSNGFRPRPRPFARPAIAAGAHVDALMLIFLIHSVISEQGSLYVMTIGNRKCHIIT